MFHYVISQAVNFDRIRSTLVVQQRSHNQIQKLQVLVKCALVDQSLTLILKS